MEVFLLPLALAVISLCAGAVWGAALLVWDAIRPQPSEPQIPPQLVSIDEDHYFACGPERDPIIIKISALAADKIMRETRVEL